MIGDTRRLGITNEDHYTRFNISIENDEDEPNDYFVLIEYQHDNYDYSIWRWCILSLISLNGSNVFSYCYGYISSRHDNYYTDSIHDYYTALYIVTIYHNDFNLNYDYDYDYDSIPSRYDYYHIDSIHYYNIDSMKIVTLIISIFQVFLSLVWFPVWTQV
jgi:hypothetical protein